MEICYKGLFAANNIPEDSVTVPEFSDMLAEQTGKVISCHGLYIYFFNTSKNFSFMLLPG